MTFIDNAELLRERIKKVKALETKKHIADTAREKGKQVVELREALANHRKRASLLGLREGNTAWPDATAADAALVRYRSTLDQEKDPSEPTVEEAYKTLIKTTSPIAAEAKGLVEPLIAQARATLDGFNTLERKKLEALKIVQSDTTEIDTTLAELARLLNMKAQQWLKLTPDQLEKVLGDMATVVQSIDALMANELPEEVQLFLKQAREGGATTDLFTDGVKTWLVSNKLLGRVRLSFK